MCPFLCVCFTSIKKIYRKREMGAFVFANSLTLLRFWLVASQEAAPGTGLLSDCCHSGSLVLFLWADGVLERKPGNQALENLETIFGCKSFVLNQGDSVSCPAVLKLLMFVWYLCTGCLAVGFISCMPLLCCQDDCRRPLAQAHFNSCFLFCKIYIT